MKKRAIAALLRMADAFDRRGDTESADVIEQLLQSAIDAPDVEDEREPAGAFSAIQAQQIAAALVRVADSLDKKGAYREAQMADGLLTELTQVMSTPGPQMAEPSQPMSDFNSEPTIEDHSQAPELPEIDIVQPASREPELEFDEVSLDDLDSVIDGMRLTHSQRSNREQLQRAKEKASTAREYKDAMEAWLEAAHSELGDQPIRLVI